MSQLQLLAGGGKSPGAIAMAVVGKQTAHADAELSVVSESGAQESNGGGGALVGENVGEGDARMIVDSDVHLGPSGTWTAAATTAIGAEGDGAEAAQHLDIQVQQIARVRVLITDSGRRWFEIAEASQTTTAKDAAHGGPAESGLLGDMNPGEALAS
ncbi:MAG: hypothetical protein WCC92_18770 [Candidatus Korobacteraceae bacterium]